jgi:hypothetical protein
VHLSSVGRAQCGRAQVADATQEAPDDPDSIQGGTWRPRAPRQPFATPGTADPPETTRADVPGLTRGWPRRSVAITV